MSASCCKHGYRRAFGLHSMQSTRTRTRTGKMSNKHLLSESIKKAGKYGKFGNQRKVGYRLIIIIKTWPLVSVKVFSTLPDTQCLCSKWQFSKNNYKVTVSNLELYKYLKLTGYHCQPLKTSIAPSQFLICIIRIVICLIFFFKSTQCVTLIN